MSNEWKIKRDSFYSALHEIYDLEYIEKIGFFFDSNEENIDVSKTVNILCTPFGDLNKETVNEKTCVLITSGGFAPLHHGHINMMEKAREVVEADGWKVACGYFAPDHDEYINKKCGENAIDIYTRIETINDLTKSIPWLTVDPWPGAFNTCAINFTDIVDRLSAYIKHHVGKEVAVFFVCGGDNARFSKVFEHKGHCVVVGRPRFGSTYTMYKNFNKRDRGSQERNSNNIYFIDADIDLCSKDIRESKNQ